MARGPNSLTASGSRSSPRSRSSATISSAKSLDSASAADCGVGPSSQERAIRHSEIHGAWSGIWW